MLYSNFEIHSPLAPAAVSEKLRGQLRAPVTLAEKLKHIPSSLVMLQVESVPPYCGSVGETEFHIYRAIFHRNSFLPQVRGQIAAEGTGSMISGKVYMPFLPGLLVLLWLIVALALGVFALFYAGIFLLALFAFGLFAFGVGLISLSYFPEAKMARRFMTGLWS